MNNASFRQWIVLQVSIEAFPVERCFLASPIDPLEDDTAEIIKILVIIELICLVDILHPFMIKPTF